MPLLEAVRSEADVGGETELSEQCSALHITQALGNRGTEFPAPVRSALEKLMDSAVVLNASP